MSICTDLLTQIVILDEEQSQEESDPIFPSDYQYDHSAYIF